jgi:hypothetical protein
MVAFSDRLVRVELMAVMSLGLSSCKQGTIGHRDRSLQVGVSVESSPSNDKNLVPIAPQTSMLITHTHWLADLRITNEALGNLPRHVCSCEPVPERGCCDEDELIRK